MSDATQADAVAIDRLREAAEAATPGNWRAGKEVDGGYELFAETPDLRPTGDVEWLGDIWHGRDAAYIAAANPAAILSLITAYESQAERLREVEEIGAGLLKAYRAVIDRLADDEFDMAAEHPASWASRMEAALRPATENGK